jgi:pimeloyl-ACP methyl ester carboxylesterase
MEESLLILSGGSNMAEYCEKVIEIEHQGRKIYGVSYLPKIESDYPLVIFCHGYNGGYTNFKLYSEYLAQHEIGAYCFDFCGGSVHSKSDLITTEMTLFTEKEDLCAVINAVQTWDHVDTNNIFLFGASQGGLISALVAEERIDDIKGLILLFPAFSIPEIWNKRFPTLESIPETFDLWGMMLGRSFFETIHGYDAFEHIGKFNKDVFILHGELDEVITQQHSEKAATLYPRVQLQIFEGEGHGFSEQGNKRVIEMTYDFLKANT